MKLFCKKIIFIFVMLYCANMHNAQAVKIVAYVNEGIITDVDVMEFEKILCLFDKRFKCGGQESLQMSMLGLVESELKSEHFKQIDLGKEKQQIDMEFMKYKEQICKNMKIKNLPKSFENYLYAEYLWGIMMSSQIKENSITQKEIDEYIDRNNLSKENAKHAKQMILQEKLTELSQNTLNELKKFYLVDIKGL